MSKAKFENPYIFYLGIAATIIGITGFIPLVEHVNSTKKTANFPYITLYIAILSNLLWILYGILNDASATIVMGALYFAIYAFILYIKYTN
jgi:uncharacterized protein with PQ loop repeat